MKRLLRFAFTSVLLASWLLSFAPQGIASSGSKAVTCDLQRVLEQEYDLRQQYQREERRYYRMWMTLEQLDSWGKVQFRQQWRGDLERIVESVDPSGRAVETVTWKNVGFRIWDMAKAQYGRPQALKWAEGFSYHFSGEDGYEDLGWDYSEIPKSSLGVVFRAGFQITAHFEFDFMRSSRHAAIEKLRKVGQQLWNPPEEGQVFHLNLPPLMVNSRLKREHVRVGFLGLSMVNGEPCAIIDYEQGPHTFTWDTRQSQHPAFEDKKITAWHTEMTSLQYGKFVVRVRDGSLVWGEFTEPTMSKLTPADGGEPVPNHTRGMWAIHEITDKDYQGSDRDWGQETSPTPVLRPHP